MNVNEFMEQKAVTKYRLSKNSGIPYTTICDICSGKTKLENCSARTVYKIAGGVLHWVYPWNLCWILIPKNDITLTFIKAVCVIA